MLIGAETIFRLGEQTLVKKKQSRQSNSKYNFMQYVFFEKKAYAVYNGVWGKAREAGEFSTIYVLQVTAVESRVTLNCKLQKKIGGAGCSLHVLVAPPIILMGEQLLPLLPRFPRLCLCLQMHSMVFETRHVVDSEDYSS